MTYSADTKLDTVIKFLMGEAALDGVWFGDSDTDNPRPRYWWRKHLRAAIEQQEAVAVVEDDIVEYLRGYEIDHEPEGWPAIKQKYLSAAAAEIESLRTQLAAAQARADESRDNKIAAMHPRETSAIDRGF